MAVREKSPFIPNGIYYITFTILGWRKIFNNDKYCNLIYKWFDYIKNNYGNKIHGYAIMPNHLHILMYVSDKSPVISKLIFNSKRFLAYGIVDLLEGDGEYGLLKYFRDNKEKLKAQHKVFEDRYDSLIIQTEKLFLEKLNYIHNNPCQEKWGLDEYPEDYKHSSAANYILGRGVYPVDLIDF
jgi:REP element-mobilizing transposase RayT